MPWLVKQVFFALLSFSGYLAIKFMTLNNASCVARPTLIDLNHVELNHYSFMISLDKYNGTCNVVDDLSTKICFLTKAKGINVKIFNVITRINKAKTLVKHISYDFKCRSVVEHVIQIENRTMINSI